MIGQHLNLFKFLNQENVEYLLIGGTLSIVYGVPRVTKDIDLFLNPKMGNAVSCLKALRDFGMGTADLTTAEELCKKEVTIFKDFLRVDILTHVKGLIFREAWKNKVVLSLEDITIPSLCLDDLIKSKKAAGRPRDIEDIKILEMARKKT